MCLNNVIMENAINERIRKICDYYFSGNASEMARVVDVKQSTIRDIIGIKQSKPSFETLKSIVDCPTIKVNASWLLTGKGNVLDEANGAFYFEFKDGKNSKAEYIEEPVKNKISVLQTRPRVPLTAAAGSLSGDSIGVTLEQCEQMPLIHQIPSYDFTMFIKGDSMSPRFESGDEIACRHIDQSRFIQWGKVHVLDTTQGFVIKRVYEDGNKIRCVSYNPEYADFSIPKEDILSMSLVVGVVSIMEM